MSYTEFLNRFNIPATPKEFAIVFDAIPNAMRQLFRGTKQEISIRAQFRSPIMFGEVDVTKKTCSNKLIRTCQQKITLPYGRFFWSSIFGEVNWKRVWLMSDTFCITNKIKEVTYKIIHNVYPAKKTLERFKLDIDYSCTFCEQHMETISHLFYHCTQTI